MATNFHDCESCGADLPGARRMTCSECNTALCFSCEIEHNTARCGLIERASDRAQERAIYISVTWTKTGASELMTLEKYSQLRPEQYADTHARMVRGGEMLDLAPRSEMRHGVLHTRIDPAKVAQYEAMVADGAAS